MQPARKSSPVSRSLKTALLLVKYQSFDTLSKNRFDLGHSGLAGGKALVVSRALRALFIPVRVVDRLRYRLRHHEKD